MDNPSFRANQACNATNFLPYLRVNVEMVSKIMKLGDYDVANNLKTIVHNWNPPNYSFVRNVYNLITNSWSSSQELSSIDLIHFIIIAAKA